MMTEDLSGKKEKVSEKEWRRHYDEWKKIRLGKTDYFTPN